MTSTEFIKKAFKLFSETNKTKFSFKWIKQPQLIIYPTGYKGYRAIVRITAEGYKQSDMIVECDSNGYDMSIC